MRAVAYQLIGDKQYYIVEINFTNLYDNYWTVWVNMNFFSAELLTKRTSYGQNNA